MNLVGMERGQEDAAAAAATEDVPISQNSKCNKI